MEKCDISVISPPMFLLYFSITSFSRGIFEEILIKVLAPNIVLELVVVIKTSLPIIILTTLNFTT
ncbi:hypothetical protein RhiirA4_471841 [Rhizophagus irregularis]|uniref:Uncharacterized protein n=1 Tax=Rhizophagus irregularis TaxID=588596 RepID=A0A2I1H3U0_9GLOM|nr:hypothetical protein RhiirA4_471841 [Rhizophagus irregularis]